jgi:rare lipoprotein A
MHANASNDRYFPRMLGDIRLRDRRDARKEHRPTGVAPENAETLTDRSQSLACAAAPERWPADYGSERLAQRSTSFEPVTNACSSAPDHCCGPVRVAGTSQFGKASWYDQVGSPTASGESLDTFTATAAHRSLPLASYAKVTNLDNRRSVIVKINDRGPYIRGRIMAVAQATYRAGGDR